MAGIRYHQLWWPLAKLTIFFEAVLRFLGEMVNAVWGLAILMFAVIIKIVLLPLSFASERAQNRVAQVQSTLLPQLTTIKSKYDGEEAHNKIMAAHKQHGVSPFFTLKPLLLTLLQIPFLIAIFNALGEMPELQGAGLLWIDDLALPDMLFNYGAHVPLFGEWFNLLPFIMAGITLLATVNYGDQKLPVQLVKNQRMRLYLMALVFFYFVFSFSSSHGLLLEFWSIFGSFYIKIFW